MFVQFSHGFASGCLRFDVRRIQVSASLRLTVAKHSALPFDQAEELFASVQKPQLELITPLALH